MAIGDVNRAKLYYLRERVGKRRACASKRYGTARSAAGGRRLGPRRGELCRGEAPEAEARGREAEVAVEEPDAEADEPPKLPPTSPQPTTATPSAEQPSPQLPATSLTSRRRARAMLGAWRADRPEAPEVRPGARRPLRRGADEAGRGSLAGPLVVAGRPARLRVLARAPRPAARLPQRLEAVLRGAARGALPRGRRVRRAVAVRVIPPARHRPRRPAQVEPRTGCARCCTRCRRRRRRASSTASGSGRRRPSTPRSSTATRRAPRSPPRRSSRR